MSEVVKRDALEQLGMENWSEMKSMMDEDYKAFVEAFPYEASLIISSLIKEKIEEEEKVVTINDKD